MKTFNCILRVLLLLPLFNLAAQKGPEQSIVKVTAYFSGTAKEIGAGIVTGFSDSDKQVFLVTAQHLFIKKDNDDNIIEEAERLTVEFQQDRKEFPATIYRVKEDLDLAVLQVGIQGTAIDFNKLVVAQSSDFVKRPVRVIGHPQGGSWVTTTSSSYSKDKERIDFTTKDGIDFTITRGDTSKGYSGGGVYTNNNRLMGLMLKIGSHYALVLDVLPIKDLLKEWKVETNLWGKPKMNLTEVGIMGGGAAGVLVSLFVFENKSKELYSTYEERRFETDQVYDGTSREQVFDDAKSKHNTAIITGVVGGVVLAAGTYMLIRKLSKRKKEKRYDGLVVVPHFDMPDYVFSSGHSVTVGVTIHF